MISSGMVSPGMVSPGTIPQPIGRNLPPRMGGTTLPPGMLPPQMNGVPFSMKFQMNQMM
jgi:hypothetical protein